MAANSVNWLIWSVFWRYSLVSALVSVAAGFAVGFMITLIWKFGSGGAPTPDWVSTTNAVGGGIAGIICSFFALRWVILNRLDKQAGGLRLMLVDAGESN